MIQFTSLRIHGFKSFVDRTELDIGTGLNGIVGPNGCGKSNLVEAMRWIMGENSPKRMRGSGMEDVIFNGTTQRPPRNSAEVTLILDNTSRTAPAAYNNTDEIEITRRIERDHGSTYKINGKTVRARDVQMFFADTVTGANSPSLVSQGRIAQIINSKPFERRLILEESAGITGLYARRHEAELRLKAADTNLRRVDDILAGQETRLGELKRQARQATRYRNVSGQIRELEIILAWLEWQALEERMKLTRAKFDEAESAVSEKMGVVTQLTKTQETQARDLPYFRQKEAESAAALQNKRINLQRLEDEIARHDEALQEAKDQFEQMTADKAHENHVAEESQALSLRLEEEKNGIVAEQESESGHFAARQAARDTLEGKVQALEEQYNTMMQASAEAKAQKKALEQQVEQNAGRIQTLQARKEKAAADLVGVKKDSADAQDLKAIEDDISNLEKLAADLSSEIETLRTMQSASLETVTQAREALAAAESRQSKYMAELSMLQGFFDTKKSGSFAPVLNIVKADEGFEKALSRALGDALLASLDDKAPARWTRRHNLELPALPAGIDSIASRIKAPEEMKAALSQIGLVQSEAVGHTNKDTLKPGQSLVSRDGFYWRWDGLAIKPDATDRNTQHLQYKNQLAELEKMKSEIENDVSERQVALQKVQTAHQENETRLKELSEKARANEERLKRDRTQLLTTQEKRVRIESELTRLNDTIKMAEEDLHTLQEQVHTDRERLETYESAAHAKKEQDILSLRQTLLEARETHQGAVRAFDLYEQQQNTRNARLHAIADERINMQNRMIRSRERIRQLEERQTALSAKIKELKNQPQNFEADKQKFFSEIALLEQQRTADADVLAACENDVNETGKLLKQAEGVMGQSREERAHAQALSQALEEQRTTMQNHIVEQFGMQPEILPEQTKIEVESTPEAAEELRHKKERYTRERDNIGPVNLRADDEAQEMEKEVTAMLNERNDLMEAIAELRRGIDTINREARDRLLTAFEHVNAHFKTLFGRLFAGGQAHLALIDTEDPLEAGLEIFAQPPGKTLQSLSLLSGGEQTLASIALIFSMFLTNPSPICVLDEIDAPLDDANVDKVCDLLDEISERRETKFMIITHHRLTMARMDRLYGVTMAEKGVSQLVSVDLQQSFSFLEAA
ncbi:MAG: chromosome segregation protein SMC [Alphaproteobacteria bacterium]